MAKSKVPDIRAIPKSQEYVDDSASESDSEPHSESSSRRKESSTPSGAQSSSQSEVESDSSAVTGASHTRRGSSSTSSSSDESTGSKRRSKTSRATEPAKKKSKLESHRSNGKQRSLNPPSGYESIDIDSSKFTAETEGMFSSLNTKQIWHITAPASVPITSIETLDIQGALRGEPILEYNSISYKMFATAFKGETLLLPTNANKGYSKAKVDVSRHFHLREMTDDSPASEVTGSSGAKLTASEPRDNLDSNHPMFFAQKAGEKELPRAQPAGLLMRYRPYGGTVGASKPYRMSHPDEIDGEETQTMPNPKSIVPIEVDNVSTRIPKKSKKHKKSKYDEASRENGISREDAMEIDMGDRDATNFTPRSTSQKGEQKPESERKKKKKERKEKA